MPENKNLVQCYNRGCGQLFDPSDNSKGKFLDFSRTQLLMREFYSCTYVSYTMYNMYVIILFEDACIHHPGVPIFHDAYKGWSCCNKKSVDFTEFLNIKGCSRSKHSNEVSFFSYSHLL